MSMAINWVDVMLQEMLDITNAASCADGLYRMPGNFLQSPIYFGQSSFLVRCCSSASCSIFTSGLCHPVTLPLPLG